MIHESVALLESMLRSRRFDEELLTHTDLIRGHFHVSIGLEATAAALAMLRGDGDLISTTYRNHAHLAALGSDLAVMFAEILGKGLGPQHGRSGSIHLSDPDRGILHTSAMVSGGVPLALGHAFALKRARPGAVCFCFFGDGAFGEGAIHECLNLSALWELPVLLICENNGARVPGRANAFQTAGELGELARAHGIESRVVDARHVQDVAEVMGELMTGIRDDQRPRFLDAQSAPWPGNQTFLPHDATGPTELQGIPERGTWSGDDDPVVLEYRRLATAGTGTGDIARLDEQLRRTIAECWDRAVDAPIAPAELAFTDVVSR